MTNFSSFDNTISKFISLHHFTTERQTYVLAIFTIFMYYLINLILVKVDYLIFNIVIPVERDNYEIRIMDI